MMTKGLALTRMVGGIFALWTFAVLPVWAASAAERHKLTYALSISGFTVGSVELNGVLTDKAYNVRGSMGGAGIGRAFVPARYSGSVSGFIRRGKMQPHEFSARFDRGRKYFTVDMSYKSGRPSQVNIFPIPAKRSYDLNFKRLRNVLDPLSVTFEMLRPTAKSNVCNRKQDVYEGRRLSRITLLKPTLNSKNGEISCAGTYTRVDGYPPDLMQKQTQFEFDITFDELENGLYQVKSFVTDTTFGKAKGVRK